MSNILDMPPGRSFPEKSSIATIVSLLAVFGAYGSVAVGVVARDGDLDALPYKPLLVLAVVVLGVMMAVSHAALAIRRPADADAFDRRDRDIAHQADAVGGHVLAAAVFAAITLVLLDVNGVYVANALMLGWVVAEVTGHAWRLVLYRRGG